MIIQDDENALIERRETPKPHPMSLLGEIYVERGTKEDWQLLHELHYKAANLGIGPSIYRCVLHGKTIGVGVMTVPKMLLSGRNKMFVHLRPNVNGKDTKMTNRRRAEWLNENTLTNSRLVLDTVYRGAGIAYRMQNLMMRMTGKQIIEFQSSMSKFNPFAARAGVKFAKPGRSSGYEKGLTLFNRWFETTPTDHVGVMEEIESMPRVMREKCIGELRKFYFDFSSMEKSGDNRFDAYARIEELDLSKLVKNIQQLVFASPLYGVYMNPDSTAGAALALPPRLPLLAFDNQSTDQPLDLSKL